MCTAISFSTDNHYFGRNLDLEYSYQETITITPRNYPFVFRNIDNQNRHYAMIGMAYVAEDYPLYYDAVNEEGLGMAGLSFPGNARYYALDSEKENVAPFELIPYILGNCADVDAAEEMLTKVNIVKEAFSQELPLTPLHWMISDKKRSIVVETLENGMRIYENPTGVMTNNPPFRYQLFGLNNYMALSKEQPVNRFSDRLDFDVYSRGMGAIGMPGDLSSASRFIRAVFTKENSVCGEGEMENVSQFFHILGAVEQQRGLVHIIKKQEGKKEQETNPVTEKRSKNEYEDYEITIYSSCCNTEKGIYYYRTYDNSQITAVDMYKENLDGQSLTAYPMLTGQQIRWQNHKRSANLGSRLMNDF